MDQRALQRCCGGTHDGETVPTASSLQESLVSRVRFGGGWEADGLLFSTSTAEGSLGLEMQVGRLTVNCELKHSKPLIPSPSTSSFLKSGGEKKDPFPLPPWQDCPRVNQNLKPLSSTHVGSRVTVIRRA